MPWTSDSSAWGTWAAAWLRICSRRVTASPSTTAPPERRRRSSSRARPRRAASLKPAMPRWCSPCWPTIGPSRDVAFGENGILASLAPGATHVSSSTISVALSERLAAAHADAGQRYAAAPVFGRPEAAAAAKLFVITAGAPEVLDALSALFDAIGQRTFAVSERPATACSLWWQPAAGTWTGRRYRPSPTGTPA